MKNVNPIVTKFILLLGLLAAGWFIYNLQKQKTELPQNPHSNHQTKENIEGIVTEYGSNPEGDIDKILLTSNSEKYWLHFPPHAAKLVTKAAPLRADVEVNIAQHHRPGPHINAAEFGNISELMYLKNKSTNAEIDFRNIPAPAPREGINIEIKGNAKSGLKIDIEKENAFTLSGKLISLPPHMARELSPLIRNAKVISVTGKMRDTTEGFVSASGKPVVKASSIRLDSITYKIR